MTTLSADDTSELVRTWLEEIAGHRKPAESMKAMLLRVAREAGLTASRAKKLWYRELGTIPWHEAEMIRRRAQEIKDIRNRWLDSQRREWIASERIDLERLRPHEKISFGRSAEDREYTEMAILEAEEAGQQRLGFD